jgi:hypothetical protein
MKHITFALVLLAFLAGPAVRAHAEDKENPYVKTREMQKKESEEAEKQYKRTLDATRGSLPAPVKSDPWANMRNSGATNASQSK